MIYLDNSATTRPFDEVLQAASEDGDHFNPSSLYAPAMRAENILKQMRSTVLNALRLPPDQWMVTLTSSGTESANLAIIGAALALRKRKGHFITTTIEHPAVRMSVRVIEEMGHSISFVSPDATGIVRPEAVYQALCEDTALISVMQVNNETGARQPIEEIAALCRKKCPDVLFHCDGVQGFLRDHIGLADIDLYSVSAHKIHGPKGTGALIRKKGVRLLPLLHGGGQEDGLRSGTENVPAAKGFTIAVERLLSEKDLAVKLRVLKLRLWKGILEALPDVHVNGPSPDSPESAPHILNLSFPVRGETLLHALEGEGILVSTGSACSSRRKDKAGPLRAMGLSEARVEGALRFSLSLMNDQEEIDQTIDTLKRIVPPLMKYKRR